MRQQAMGFLKGVGAGMLAGAALVAVNGKMMKNDRHFRRRADKTMRTVSELLDNMQGMFH